MKVRKEFVRGGETVSVIAERLEGDNWRVRVGDRVLEVMAQPLSDGGVRIVPVGAEMETAAIAFGAPAGKQFMVRINGRTHTLALPAGRGRGDGGAGDGTITAPMTGTVLEVLCKPGDSVAADQTLIVLSAMKMEHKLTAGIAGTVQSIAAVAGDTVDQGAELAIVEPVAPDEPAAGKVRP